MFIDMIIYVIIVNLLIIKCDLIRFIVDKIKWILYKDYIVLLRL